jgi:hypothetical protein
VVFTWLVLIPKLTAAGRASVSVISITFADRQCC